MHIIFKTVLLFSGLIAVAAARPTQSHSSAHPPHDADEEFPLSGHFRRDKPTPKELNEFFTESSEEFEDRISSLDHAPTKEELIEIFNGHDVAAPKEEQVNDDELGQDIALDAEKIGHDLLKDMPQTIDTGLKLVKTLLKDLKTGHGSRKHKQSKHTEESVEKTEEKPVSKRSEPANNKAPADEDTSVDHPELTMEEIAMLVIALEQLKDRPDLCDHKQSTPTQQSADKTEDKHVSKRSEAAITEASGGADMSYLDDPAFTDSKPTMEEVEQILYNTTGPDRAAKLHELQQDMDKNHLIYKKVYLVIESHHSAMPGETVEISPSLLQGPPVKRSEPTNATIEQILFNSSTPHRAAKIHELEEMANNDKALSDRIIEIGKKNGGTVTIGKRNAGKNEKSDLLDDIFALVEKHAAAEGLTKEEILGLIGQKLDEGLAALDKVVHKEQISKRDSIKNTLGHLLYDMFVLVKEHTAAKGKDLTNEENLALLRQILERVLARGEKVVPKEQ